MTGKAWIDGVTDTLLEKKRRLERDNERLMTLRAEVITMTAIRYDTDKVQMTYSDDKISQKYALMDEISRRMFKEMEDYNIYRARSIKRLNNMVKNPTLAKLLELRHIEFKTNAEIAVIMSITERWVIKQIKKAYDLLNSIYILEKYRRYSKKVDSSPQNVVV